MILRILNNLVVCHMLVLKYGQKKFVPSNGLLGRTIVQTILNSISFNIWLY